MKKQGTVVRWDGAKAFGFIRSPQTPTDIFFHIRDFKGPPAPGEGLAVEFEEIHVGGKGPRAMAVTPVGKSPARRDGVSPAQRNAATRRQGRDTQDGIVELPYSVLLLMLLWLALLLGGIWFQRLFWWLLPVALALNLLTYITYWLDKQAAQSGNWRTPESTLHTLGLLGGWPGAWFAHQMLRHKSAKQAFREVYWQTALLHMAALGVWVLLPWLPWQR